MNTLLSDRQVSLIHTLSLPDHSVSNHLAPTVVALTRYPSALQLLVSESDFRHRYAGSSGIPGRIEFVIILRTGRSPPAAPHPASWRRSCIRFQAGERIPGEDLHLSDCACSQAHTPPASAAWCFNFDLEQTSQRFRTPPTLVAWSFNFDLILLANKKDKIEDSTRLKSVVSGIFVTLL